MQIAVIADQDTAIGFKLAGVGLTYPVTSIEEARRALERLSKRDDIGTIIITERLADNLRDLIKELYKKTSLIIVEIPDKYGPIEREVDPIRELIRTTLGVEIKFKKSEEKT
ncbi:MAG: V-type ATP synthase subunit F [Candidatus Baldrarchaeia archaeon]